MDNIKDRNPISYLFIAEPVFDQSEYVNFSILTTRDFNQVRDVPETLLKSGFIARMDPENPCCR